MTPPQPPQDGNDWRAPDQRYGPPPAPAPAWQFPTHQAGGPWQSHPGWQRPSTGPLEPPAGSEYHRLARNAAHRWWRPVAATGLLLALALPAMAVVVGGGYGLGHLLGLKPGKGDHFFAHPVPELTISLGLLAVLIPVTLLAARLAQRRRPGTLSSVVGRLRWRWLLACLGATVVAETVKYPLLILLDSGEEVDPLKWVGWPAFALAMVVILALVPFQAAAEEYVFRGWIPQAFGCWLRTPWVGVAVGGVLFALAHGLGTWWGFVDLLLFSAVASWLTQRTGGLESAIANHAANNLTAFSLAAAFGELASDETAADGPWQLPVVDVLSLGVYAWLVLLLARRLRPARVSGGSDQPAGAVEPAGPGYALGANGARDSEGYE